MLRRLRPLAVVLAVLGAVVVPVATAGPAAAAVATTCAEPSVSGSVGHDYFSPPTRYDSSTVRLRITATGRTTANCSNPVQGRYLWKVKVESNATETQYLTSGDQSWDGTATTFPFSSASFTAPKGSGVMRLTITTYKSYAGQRYAIESSATRTYRIDVPGDYNTENAEEVPEYCPAPVKPLGYTKWGGCEA